MEFEEISIQEESGSQIIRIPDSLRINDDKVYLKRMGNALYIIPVHNSWQTLIDSVHDFSEDFMDDRQQPDGQSRDFFE